jgi:autotransporter passenger strand-loop-strand repeat protein
LAGGVTRGTVLSGGSEVVSSGGTASGTIVASCGTETVRGRASGGTIKGGGVFEVASGGTASGTVGFVSGGTLQLDIGASFTGAIKGFAKPDRIDLRRIAFGAGTTRSFVEAASHTSGTLTVSDGAHTVHLKLLGIYTTSNFKLATDGHGGTLVTDPPAASGASGTTFADIAPAQPLAGAANSGNQLSYLTVSLATNQQAYAGQTLLAIGPPGGGDHSLLPTSR